jgi:hypothetical protein
MRAGLNHVLRALGVTLPVVTGLALPDVSSLAPTVHPLVAFAVLAVVGLVAGLLLRAWLAPTLVPLAFVAGLVVRLIAGYALGPFLGLSSGAWSVLDGARVLLVAIAVLVVPLVLGTLVGVPVGVWLEERLTTSGRT